MADEKYKHVYAFFAELSGIIFVILSVIALLLGCKLVGAICLAAFLAREVWLKKAGFAKLVILIIIIERLSTSWFSIWWREYSRGGAKFHFEDFKTTQEMQKYFETHYPTGSSLYKLVHEVEIAGGKCGLYFKDYPFSNSFYYDCETYSLVKMKNYIIRLRINSGDKFTYDGVSVRSLLEE